MPSLTLITLPPEVIFRIIDLADPSTHLNIAYTCSHLHGCAKRTLDHHREAHKKFSVISDHNPSTIPTLLRSASGITSPIDAWHVQHIELWGSRWNWREWRPWALHRNSTALPPVPKRRQAFVQSPVLEWSIPRWELAYYLEIMSKELRLPEKFVDSARAELDKGCDSVMQMLLIVLCPQLRSLKYMYNKHDKVANRRSLHWLTSVMGKSCVDGSWPPGLRNLGHVAVGVRSETWLDEKIDKLWYTRSCFRGLLKLPGIKSLYFRGLRPQDRPAMPSNLNRNCHPGGKSIFDYSTAPGFEDADKLPTRCSTIEHLYLESIGDYREVESLAAAFETLKSYTLHGGDLHFGSYTTFDVLLEAMVEKQHQSLESVLVYSASQFEGHDCALYRIGGGGHIQLHSCPKLRRLYIHWDDVFFPYHEFPWGTEKLKDAWKDPTKRENCIDHILSFFPMSLEVLMLGNSRNQYAEHDYLFEAGFERFDFAEQILVRLASTRKFPTLRHIFIEQPDDGYDFAKLVKAGQKHGVHIYVKANTQAPEYQVQLPEPPQVLSQPSQQDASERGFGLFGGYFLPFSTPQVNNMSPYYACK